MIKNELLKKHYARLRWEAIIRSAVGGIAIGFGVNFLFAALEWLLGFGNFILAIIVWAAASLVSAVPLYVFKYRPDMKDTARRVDRFGLDERMITMLEYEKDDSYIAELQRENAKAHYAKVSDRKLKIRLSALLILLALVGAVFGSSMTAVVALADSGVVPAGPDILTPDDPYVNYIPVTYIVDEGGYISGEAEQLVEPGADAEPVIAIAEDGWMFVGWDDESTDPARHDKRITEPLELTAIFEEVEDDEGGSGQSGAEGPSEKGEEGDQATDQPSQDGSQSSSGEASDQNGEQSGEEGSDGESNNENENQSNSESDSDDNKGSGAGGKWEETNMFYDGQTYYKDALEYYYEYAKELFEENGEIPPELEEFFELYYNSI